VQEENKFFRFLWRVDAILLALAGIGVAILVIVILLAWLLRPRYEPNPEGHFRPVPKNAEQNYTYRLEDQAYGAALPHQKMLALRRWKGAPASYGLEERAVVPSSTYSYADAVNLLVIDTATGASRWLFKGYKRLVVSQDAIYGGGQQWPVPATGRADQKPPIALVIHSVDADTNGDGEIDSKDIQSLYFFRPNDPRAIKFFAADYILSKGETDAGDYLVVYEKGRSAFAATFHIPDFKLKFLKRLPDVPP